MNNKTRIRITESDLHRIVRESVNRVLTEMDEGWTLNMGSKLKPSMFDGKNDHIRKQRAMQYLRDRYQRQGGYSDEQMDTLANGDTDDSFSSNQLRQISKDSEGGSPYSLARYGRNKWQ